MLAFAPMPTPETGMPWLLTIWPEIVAVTGKPIKFAKSVLVGGQTHAAHLAKDVISEGLNLGAGLVRVIRRACPGIAGVQDICIYQSHYAIIAIQIGVPLAGKKLAVVFAGHSAIRHRDTGDRHLPVE